ncbi:MAG: polysulfide reductase NrfD [Candidatus Stahlbacteria bacterium]|nr:polysulfide reductase NrfD [Candidatus Stahlbacteria bacterium]
MEHVNWGLPVALDLFFAGLGAGAFAIAVTMYLTRREEYSKIANIGAYVAPWPVILGVILLIADLGKPYRFWEMVLKRGGGLLMFEKNSVMSIGVWLLVIFICISLIYAALTLIKLPFPTEPDIRRKIGIVGLVFAVLVVVYTGVLLSATSNPLWRTWVLPPIFVLSAFTSGSAACIFFLSMRNDKIDPTIPKLERMNSNLILFQLIAILLFIILKLGIRHPSEISASCAPAMKYMIGSGYGILFWVGVIGLGLIFPLVSGIKHNPNRKPSTSMFIALFFLIFGGFGLRYIILMAGQAIR